MTESEDLLVRVAGMHVCVNLIAVLFRAFGRFPHKVQ